ncbi:hypothetical protein Sam112_gp75 [Bacillus phage vB_BcM_Sam112]|uniref:Uncharacterized protein n=1 Tax=Bacillus phage vB_BcM_Sam112 TaxID=2663324 RepID=A0A5Q2F7C2_9CAUD|nr:hypothetical protein Sam112_gp75 [Bacillus phage vB_BcM_Sam112]
MSKIAYLTKSELTGQYAIVSTGEVIFTTTGETTAEHVLDKANIIKAANKKGYTVLKK